MSLEVSVQKDYKDFSLDVSFRCDNQVLGILGASGSGKSMTLQAIAGIITPDSGVVKHNEDIFFSSDDKINGKPQTRKIGYLFQDYALFPHMTVLENIKIAIPERTEKEERITNLLERFMIDDHAHKYPDQLSGGQKQRVALARIFANQPEILLLDEAFSAMDTHLKEKLQLELMNTLKDFDGDVIMVTHSMEEAYKFCDEIVVLEDGKVKKTGHTKEIFTNPEYLSIARLTGCKNFSSYEKVGENKVYAKDWDAVFEVNRKIPEGTTSIGIRAHSFYPSEKNEKNSFSIAIKEAVESPFETNVILKSSTKTAGDIWWKHSKNNQYNHVEYLSVKEENIMFLQDDEQ